MALNYTQIHGHGDTMTESAQWGRFSENLTKKTMYLISAASKWSEGQIASGHMVQRHPDAPEVHGGPEGLAHGLAEHGPLVHVGVEVLLRAVQRDELLVVLQLPGRAEVGQLVDDGAVVLDELHDVPGFEVPEGGEGWLLDHDHDAVLMCVTCGRDCCP